MEVIKVKSMLLSGVAKNVSLSPVGASNTTNGTGEDDGDNCEPAMVIGAIRTTWGTLFFGSPTASFRDIGFCLAILLLMLVVLSLSNLQIKPIP